LVVVAMGMSKKEEEKKNFQTKESEERERV
jgi:hypothetical protein